MPTPEQKRQAAAIFTAASEGKVIEYNPRGGENWISVDPFVDSIRSTVCHLPQLFRIAPDPIAPGWNPDKLTVSQVGEGWRLLEREETIRFRNKWVPKSCWWRRGEWSQEEESGYQPCWINGNQFALRTRLSVEALAALDKPCEHKAISLSNVDSNTTEAHCDHCGAELFKHHEAPYWRSTKPAWRLPDPPAGGPPWHRNDFTEADLPEGCRPLLKGEKIQDGDQSWWKDGEDKWRTHKAGYPRTGCETADHCPYHKFRTRRPLPRTRPWSFEEAPVHLKLKSKEKGMPAVATLMTDGYMVVYDIADDYDRLTFAQMLESFVQLDGSPCGAKCETTEAK